MAATILGYPRFQGIDGNGNPVRGGKLTIYTAGTTTLNATIAKSDKALLVAHTNPIILDSNGESTIYLTGQCKMNLTTAIDGQVPGWPIDEVDAIVVSTVAADATFLTEHNSTGTHAGKFLWTKGADVASANAMVLGTDGNYFDITGATQINTIGTLGVGTVVKLHFDGALTLNHNATDLVLPGGADIITVGGDEYEFTEYAAGDWRLSGGMRYRGWAKGADVASAAALPIINDGRYFDVTGAVTITSINALGIGETVGLHFDSALTITHHATNLVLPGGANIITVADDEYEFTEYAAGQWRLTGGNSLGVATGNFTVTGGITISGAAPSPPVANTIYKDNIIGGRARWNGTDPTSVLDSYNVTSISDDAVGIFTVTWDLDYANVNYCLAGVASETTAAVIVSPGTVLAGSAIIRTINVDTSALADSTNINIITSGDQS